VLCWLLATFACASYLLSTAFRSSFLFPAGFDPSISRFRKGAQERGMSGMYLNNLMLTIRTKESKEMMSILYKIIHTNNVHIIFISLDILPISQYPRKCWVCPVRRCALMVKTLDTRGRLEEMWLKMSALKKLTKKQISFVFICFLSVIHKWQICHCSAEVSSVCSFRMIYFVFFWKSMYYGRGEKFAHVSHEH